MKRLKLFFACLLMAVLSIGQVWGADEVVYTLTPASGSNNSYTGNCDVEIDGITWNLEGNSQQNPWRIGGGKNTGLTNVNRAVYSKTAMDNAITKVELTVGEASGITVNSLKLIVASNADFSSVIEEVTETFAANSKITFTPESPATEWAANAFYKFVFNVSVSGKNNKYLEFTKADFYAEESTGGDVIVKTLKSIAVTGQTTEFDQNADFAFDGICTATYSVTKNDVAQPDEEEEVTPTSVSSPDMTTTGQKEVTVSFTDGDVTKTAKYNITVNAVEVPTLTFDFSAQDYENSKIPTLPIAADGNISINFGDGENDGKYYNTGTAIRVYGGGHMTVSGKEGVTISKIVLTFGTGDGSNAISTGNVGTYSNGKWTGSAQEVTFNVATLSGNHRRIKSVAVFYEVAAVVVAKPEISGEEDFLTSTEVTLACATEGATIYYTTDGSDPKESTTTGTSFNLTETATVRAIAKKGSDWSAEADSKTFTKITPYTTIAGLAEDMTDTETPVHITLGNWQVSVKINNRAFVTDGTNGLIIFESEHGLNEGDILAGTIQCNLVNYNDVVELTGVKKDVTPGLTVTAGTIEPVVKTVEEANDLTALNTGLLVKLENVTYNGSAFEDDNNHTIAPYTSFYNYSSDLVEGKKYNVTGIIQQYDSKSQIYPRKKADIVEIVAPEAPATPAFNPAAGTYTSVQSVEITCATEGVTIYYTTDGTTTPTNESTEYTEAIEVAENMTIKAIAINANGSSAVATAVYTINLPEDEEVVKTWDLSAASYVSTDDPIAPTTDLIQWTATYVSMKNERNGNGNTAVNNYIPSTQTSTRFYKNNKLTITPNGKQITSIVFTATTNGYASALAGSTWTNATAAADGTTVTVTPTDGTVAISAVIGNTCGFTAVQVNYIAIDLTKPATPAFNPAAGTYTSVQSVEISCATEGVTIYYTTDGTTTPTNESTEYTGAIEVAENMTIKAIAIKGDKSSAIAEAAYVINLPEDPETRKTWDLSAASYVESPTQSLIQWTATYVSMKNERNGNGNTAVNNYIPTSKTSTRFYSGNKLTITPNGKQITTIVFTATSESYASALQSSTWTNASAEVNGSTVTVTPEDGEVAISATIGGTCGFTAVQVNYIAIDTDRPAQPTFTPEADTYTEVQNVEINCTTEGITIYYTTDGSTPSSTNGNEYTGAIEVAENMTIKAVAVKGEKVSKVATAAYVIDLPVLSTMQAVFNKATLIGGTEQTVSIAFDNWVVSGISLDEKNIYVTDGSKGFVIFVSGANSGFAVNDKLNGTVSCSLKLYKGFAEVVGLTANAEGLTVTHDGIVTPMVANIADLRAVNTGAPIILKDVEFDGSDLTDGTNTIEPYTTFYSSAVTDLELNKFYVVTGLYIHYNGKDEISPRSAADIEEIVVLRDENSGVTPGVMGTICPRQEVKYPTGASFYTISHKEEVGGEPYKVFFNEIAEGASLQAGVPYLFIADESSTAIKGVKVGDEATVGQKVNGLQGVLNTDPGYVDITVDADDVTNHKYYIIYDNQVRLCGEGTFRIRDERAYIIMDEIGTNPGNQVPGRRRIALSVWGQQNATGMDNVQGEDVQSTKVLINGQLFILRGEKMYNANGQLVK